MPEKTKSNRKADTRQGNGGLAEQTYQRLRLALIEGIFAPGDRLSLRRVASSLGTSAMPVRTAIHRLAIEQALDLLPNGKAIVPRLTRESFATLSTIRAEVEPLAIRMAASALTSEHFNTLTKLVKEHEAAFARRDAEELLRADRAFLFAIYREANAPMLLQFIESLWLRRGPLFWDARWILLSRTKGRHWHPEIIDALRSRDGAKAAAALLKREIEAATKFLLENYFDRGQDRRLELPALQREDGSGRVRKARSDNQ